ncbi:FKBP-type peptidyl-prolyl cis-trans isomerase [Almyronema epifaneia]|uniref:Peptidyl-prolyl cis-trans isomerase n=1 Tax=Almyronema epifaneia S1 TaxID=2991925 RepID=A0ABW6IA75_9CYAN
MKLKKGVKLLAAIAGTGPLVERQQRYVLALRLWLNHGERVNLPNQCLSHAVAEPTKVHADGFFEHQVRIDRENLIAGIFYAVQGMRIGGYRKVAISPHLAYGEKGIPGVIPANAKLTVEIRVLRQV